MPMPRRNPGQMQVLSNQWFQKDSASLHLRSNGSQAVGFELRLRHASLLRVQRERTTVLHLWCQRAPPRASLERRENSIKREQTQGPELNRICFHLEMLREGESLLPHRLR